MKKYQIYIFLIGYVNVNNKKNLKEFILFIFKWKVNLKSIMDNNSKNTLNYSHLSKQHDEI